jgi:hypothetical protein
MAVVVRLGTLFYGLALYDVAVVARCIMFGLGRARHCMAVGAWYVTVCFGVVRCVRVRLVTVWQLWSGSFVLG